MNAEAQVYYSLLVPPQLKDNGAPTGLTYMDTNPNGVNYSQASFAIQIGTTDIATTAAPLISECDTTDGSYTAVTSAALGDAISATEDDGVFVINLDLRYAHKRYLKCEITAGNGSAGTNLSVLGILRSPNRTTGSATDTGTTEVINA